VGDFTFRLNAAGLRGPELPDPDAEPTSARRIAFLGDSFLLGEAVRDQQLVSTLTRDALRAQGESVEIYNLAGIDTGTAQQLMMLREFAPQLRPTEVVLFLYTGNDLINNSIELAGRSRVSAGDYIRPYLLADGGELLRTHTHPVRAWLRHHSRLYAEAELRLLGLGLDAKYAWLAPWPPGPGPVERLRLGTAPTEDLEVLRTHDPGHRWEKAWRTTGELVAAVRKECDELGARLLVLVVPNLHQVMRTAKGVRYDLAARMLTGSSVDAILDWDLPERRLSKLANETGVEVRALLPALRRAAAAGRIPYGRDEHFAPAGHEVASQQVLGWLAGEPDAPLDRTRGRPVWLLPEDAELGARLDFGAARHSEHLGDGWLRWIPRSEGTRGGWMAGPRALVVVRALSHELLVRGEVPTTLTLPVRGYVEVLGLAREGFELDRHGAFEVRVDMGSSGREIVTARGGYVAVEFAPGRVEVVDGELQGVLVEEIGFTPVSSDPDPGEG
jgi:hypothetical protein